MHKFHEAAGDKFATSKRHYLWCSFSKIAEWINEAYFFLFLFGINIIADYRVRVITIVHKFFDMQEFTTDWI